jgi:hypothetical protein
MNDLIHFQPAKLHRRSTSDHSGAQILFFTGVRYQRMGDDTRPSKPRAPSSAKRNGEGGGAMGARARRPSARARAKDVSGLE